MTLRCDFHIHGFIFSWCPLGEFLSKCVMILATEKNHWTRCQAAYLTAAKIPASASRASGSLASTPSSSTECDLAMALGCFLSCATEPLHRFRRWPICRPSPLHLCQSDVLASCSSHISRLSRSATGCSDAADAAGMRQRELGAHFNSSVCSAGRSV